MVQKINIGNQSNDGTGDSIREAFNKVNQNFTELYGINNLGEGLYLTKLKDTPQSLKPSTVSTATILVVDYSGNTVTQRSLVAGEGIVISNSTTGILTISNPSVSISADTNPTLGGDLDGNGWSTKNFVDSDDVTSLPTKYYVDHNSVFSRTNLYVSTNGRDTFPVTGPDAVPVERQGRALAYAFRTVNKACQVAEDIISTSSLELSTYKQFIQLNNGTTTATVYQAAGSPNISGATRVLIDLGVADATDQFATKYIRPGQRIMGRDSETIAFINTLGHTTAFTFNKELCSRDVGKILDAVTSDLILGSNYRSVTAGLAYLRSYSGIVYDTQNSQTVAGLNKARDLALALISDPGAASIITAKFAIVTDIITDGLSAAPALTYDQSAKASVGAGNAASIIIANKAFLQSEIIAYINQVIGTENLPGYNEALCRRDMGYLIDALTFDMLYGGNTASRIFGEGYFSVGGITYNFGPEEKAATISILNLRLKSVIGQVVQNTPVTVSVGNTETQDTTSYTAATTTESTFLNDRIDDVVDILNSVSVSLVDPTYSNGPSGYNTDRTLILAGLSTIQSDVLDYIDTLGNYEYYDVSIITGPGFVKDEPIMFSQAIPRTNITILIESGTYEEQLPIRVPANVSIRGDEFRRVIIKPAPLTSTSKWANLYFRRDESFDGLTKASNKGQANLAADPNNRFGYHYLTNPTDITSAPKLNEDMDVFLLNDQTILRSIGVQGHGGFMCVLDPEGQVLTKSPYMQNCSSFSKSTNEVVFSGGTYVDGFAGNLLANPTDASTYFTGTLTISVSGLDYRQPQAPTAFYYQGNRYEVDFITDFNSEAGTATLHLNPDNYGGIAYTGGSIPVSSGGTSYSTTPLVLFDQPTTPGGYAAKGVAVMNAGAIQSITITNPGTGYDSAVDVRVQFVGGSPLSAAPAFTIPSDKIQKGFVGTLPSTIELISAGNRSMLNADFTQVNDLGYGIISTNNGFQENVSVFTYYNNVAYYANNGGQFRSLNGSNAYGNYALKSNGVDPTEVPMPVLLDNDMVQTATVVSYNFGTINTVNTNSSAFLYIRGYSYLPNNQSQIDIDHGTATDGQGNTLGIQTYDVVSASTATGSFIPDLAILNLSSGAALGLGSAGGLKAPVSSSTAITIRSRNVLKVIGINQRTFLRTTSVLTLNDNTSTHYNIVGYDTVGVSTGSAKIALKNAVDYITLQTYPGITAGTGTSTVAVVDLTTATRNRVLYYTGTDITRLSFGWQGGIYKITQYLSSSTIGQPYAQIILDRNLTSTLTNVANPLTTVIQAGLRAYSSGQVTNRISVLRVSGHDMVDVGTGGYAATRIPNDLYGPADNRPSPVKERIESNKGRVFAVTTDQDGNFRVGDVFLINQNTGDLVITANLNLVGVDGLGFKRGAYIKEFSTDDTMVREATDAVPTEAAVVQYINHRLGINAGGGLQTKIGAGFLDLSGTQPMSGDLEMAGHQINMQDAKIINLTSCTNLYDAAPKIYVDQKLSLAGITSIDPETGSINNKFGIMTGKLVLVGDPVTSTDDQFTAATVRYVNKIRTFSTLSDVNLVSPADVDLLMFNATSVAVNTTTDTKPNWSATRQVTNVKNDARPSANSSSANAGGSDITVSRWVNTVTFKLVGGQGTANPITDYHVNDAAAIQQSKLAMSNATVGSTSSGVVQSNLGLARFDSTYFVDGGNGWITLKNPLPVAASYACQTCKTLTPGTGFSSASAFNGSVDRTWNINAGSTNVESTIVCRGTGGDFSAGTITAALNGVANCAQYLQVDSGSYYPGCSASKQNTIAYRDASCNITANCFVGCATNAFYADLAEKYHADQCYAPCTVLAFGGKCELTIAEDGTNRVAGVVSTNPAHTMNSGLVGEHVVTLALTGRVPVKVRGTIRKGDLMVSAGGGYARPCLNPTIGSVIGKALEDFDGVEGVIEVVVGRV
jgi:hypothetical protein